MGANLFFESLHPTQKGDENETERVVSPESVPICWKPGSGCSKLTTALVNVLLKFQMLISEIYPYFFIEKIWEAFALQKLLSFFQPKIYVY